MSGIMQHAPHHILANYFSFLEVFKFSRAMKCLKVKQAVEAPAPWSLLFQALANMTTYEASYYKLTYLNAAKPKVKLADLYAQTHMDLKVLGPGSPDSQRSTKFIKVSPIPVSHNSRKSAPGISVVSLSPEDAVFFSSLLQQVGIIIVVRVDMLAMYLSYSSVSLNTLAPALLSPPISSTSQPDYDHLLSILDALPANFRDKVTHPILYKIKNNLISEMSVLRRLLMAQVAISSSEFKDSVLLLAQCRMEFDAWRDEIKKFQSELKIPQLRQYPTALHQWLSMFQSSLTAKLTLYFYPIFRKTELEVPGSSPLSAKDLKLDPDYFYVIESFVQRTNVYNISLIHECRGCRYTCDKTEETPTGLNSWPAIFSYPKEPPREHWPNIVSILLDNEKALSQYKEPYLHFYDQKINFTYFLSRIEPQVTMAILFADKKKANEQSVWEFTSAILRALRNKDIFGLLLIMKEARER